MPRPALVNPLRNPNRYREFQEETICDLEEDHPVTGVPVPSSRVLGTPVVENPPHDRLNDEPMDDFEDEDWDVLTRREKCGRHTVVAIKVICVVVASLLVCADVSEWFFWRTIQFRDGDEVVTFEKILYPDRIEKVKQNAGETLRLTQVASYGEAYPAVGVVVETGFGLSIIGIILVLFVFLSTHENFLGKMSSLAWSLQLNFLTGTATWGATRHVGWSFPSLL
mmetsp:Transcript_52824/g.114703  ORF Transcript_52824/g.114703 Transcript_52824/m.114703 type:complete len:224 (-) Transcript_52824:286-957(-)